MTLTQLTGRSRRVMVGCRTYTTTNTATVEASLVQKLKYKYRSEQGPNTTNTTQKWTAIPKSMTYYSHLPGLFSEYLFVTC